MRLIEERERRECQSELQLAWQDEMNLDGLVFRRGLLDKER